MTKKIHFENLDGLRFLCFLSVFFFHSFHTDFEQIKVSGLYHFIKKDVFGNGNLGVNFFFVLSGFLITFLLIEEKKMNRQIDVGKFWIRRILRIWPLFYMCVIFGFYIFPIIKTTFGQVPNETASIGYYLTFLNNFDFIRKGLPDASILGVLWSVAIEEQFYLLWPVILYLLPVRKYWIAFGSVITASILFRILNPSPLMYEHHTISCIGDMATGAFGAWLILEKKGFKERITFIGKPFIGVLYATFIICFFFRDEIIKTNELISIFERLIIAVIMLMIILEQNYAKNSFFKLSQLKAITNLGKISYGLYCLHFLGILITITLTAKTGMNTQPWQVYILEPAMALFITIVISSISYKYFEKPFLKIKDRFAYIRRQD